MREQLRKHWKKYLVLFFTGLTISCLINLSLGTSGGIFLSNLFFITAMAFIIPALWQIVSNIGFFNSLKFGTKLIYRLARKKPVPSSQVKDEYVEYVNSRVKFTDAATLLVMGIVLLIISVLPFPAGLLYFISGISGKLN